MPTDVPSIEIAEQVAAAVVELEGVTGLDGGPLGAAATYGSGRRCRGVVVSRGEDRTRVRVRVTARYGAPLPELGVSIREAVEDVARTAEPDRAVAVDVEITDLVLPDASPQAD